MDSASLLMVFSNNDIADVSHSYEYYSKFERYYLNDKELDIIGHYQNKYGH